MEYALCLRHGLLPTHPQGLPFCGSTARAITKPLRIPPLSLSKYVSTLSNVKTLSPVICAVDRLWRPSKNENGDMGRGTVGASLLLACVIGVFGCSFKMTPIAIAARQYSTDNNEARTSTITPNDAITPKDALKSLIWEWDEPVSKPPEGVPEDPQTIRRKAIWLMQTTKDGNEVRKQLEAAWNKLKSNPDQQHFVTITLLQALIRQMTPSKAIAPMQYTDDDVKVKKKLKEALKKFKADKNLTLLEAFIRQENYEAAIKYCDSIRDELSNSDTRIILCKAIIYSMSAERRNEAMKLWNKLINA